MNTTSTPVSSSRPNLYERITDRIAAALEQGVRPWVPPWTAGHLTGPLSRPLDLKQVNRVLLQPHWRREAELPQ